LNEKEQELIGFTCDIELSKHILCQIRINAGEPLKEYDAGGKKYILIDKAKMSLPYHQDEKDVEHYKEEALKWEFRYKQEKNQNLDHEKDYMEVWKLIKEPDESVVGAVKRIIRERDKALKKLEDVKDIKK
jgi:hypothetical protein